MTNLLFNKTGDAVLSEDRKHRYMLSRTWDESKPVVMFIGVNPSRADDKETDNTITRCVNFAKEWGYGKMYFANLYSFRTPYVTEAQCNAARCTWDEGEEWEPLLNNLHHAFDVRTDFWLDKMIRESGMVVCAWGSWKFIENRAINVLEMIRDNGRIPHCFGVNKDGHPKHPLYLSRHTKLEQL